MPSLRSPHHRALSVVVFAGVALAACGGATDSGLFDAPAGTSSPDAGTPVTTNHDAGTTSPRDAGGTSTPHDAAPVVVDSAPPVVIDSAPPPPAATIDCAVSDTVKTCDAATQVCCRSGGVGGFGNPTYTCTTAANCNPQTSLAIPCDNNDDCTAEGFAGTVCCVSTDSTTGVASSISCVAASDCTSDNGQAPLCNDNGPCPDPDQTCTASTRTIPGYKICE